MTATQTRPDTASTWLPDRGRRRRRAALLIALAVVLILTAGWVVAFSPLFGARSVEVHGTRTLSAAQVERAADVGHGTPLIRLDTDAVVRRVERLRAVESARVETSYPSTVVITVVERRPVGYVVVYGRRVLVDRFGEQYRSVDEVPARLPKFVVPSGVSTHTTGGAVATVAAALPAALRQRVRSIEALDPQAITLVLDNGTLVRWGSAARSRQKALVAEALRQRKHPLPDQIDVTDPDQPFTR